MTDARCTHPGPRLEAAYERICKARMADLPFLNVALRVQAVGFRPWQGQWLGALVTPWSLNLVLMPGEGAWQPLAEGAERIVTLPAGRFRFVAGRDEELGELHACSLFSPVQEFRDHESACAMAAACLEALFDDGNAEPPDVDGARGSAMAREARPAVVSKRDFLRGRLSGSRHEDRG